jgi:hypothetical protein
MSNATKIPVNSIWFKASHIDLCTDWAGGTDCMLRAVASTRNLTIGTRRPGGCDSDEKWYLTIWRELSCDIGHAVSLSRRDNGYSDDDEVRDLIEFEDWVDFQIERLEESYGLSDWDACDD